MSPPLQTLHTETGATSRPPDTVAPDIATPDRGTVDGETFVRRLARNAEDRGEQRVFRLLAETGPGSELSHGELNRRARRVAALLRAAGVEAGEPVVLLFPFGLELVAAFFGCLAAGAVAVPTTDPLRLRRTRTRLVSILNDVEPRLGLTTSALRPRLAAFASEGPGVRWLAVDDAMLADVAPLAVSELPAAAFDPGSLAMIQYTSGSTSRPKGVMLSHRNLVANQRAIAGVVAQTSAARFVGWLPPYHDMGLIGLVLHPIYLGAECSLLSTLDFLRRPYRWLEAITSTRATATVAPNFALDLCVERIGEAEKRQLDLTSLEVLVAGAEPVRRATLERFFHAFADHGLKRSALVPCYGLAEATLLVSGVRGGEVFRSRWLDPAALQRGQVGTLPPTDARAWPVVSCGAPGVGVEIGIVDPRTRRPCPAGRIGEIWVTGAGVGQGYWRREEATTEVFGARWAPGAGDATDDDPRTWLRTGDLGFLDQDELFVTGRRSDLIILRGRNLHPEDVEHTVSTSHPALTAQGCAAFGFETPAGERLVVVSEIERPAVPRASAIVASARRAVAMAHDAEPWRIVLVRRGTLPRTSSGKMRRHDCRNALVEGRLAELYGARFEAKETADPTDAEVLRGELAGLGSAERLHRLRHELISRLAGLLAEEIEDGAGQVGLEPVASSVDGLAGDTVIAEVGLGSLAAARLQWGLEASFGAAPALTELMGGATVDEIVAFLAEAVTSAPQTREVESPTTQGSATGRSHRLSDGQEALWFEHERNPASSAYHLGGAVTVRGVLDLEALRRAAVLLVERHPVLASHFETTTEGPYQVYSRTPAEAAAAACGTVEAMAWDGAALAVDLDDELARPFDLGRNPPWRLCIYRRGLCEHVLLLVVHHLVADFASFEILAADWRALYWAEVGGEGAELPAVGAPFAAHVRRIGRRLAGSAGEAARRFFRRQLAGEVPILDLPGRRHGAVVEGRRAEHASRWLGSELSDAVRRVARQHRTTPFGVLAATLQILLHRTTQQEDLVIGTAVAGRGDPSFARTVGYFANTVVVRSRLTSEDPSAVVLRRTRRDLLAALDHGELPFAQLVEERRRRGVRDGVSELQTLLVYYGEGGGDLGGLLTAAALQLADAPELAAELGGAAGEAPTRCGLEVVPVHRRHSPFDLHWAMSEQGALFACTLEVDTRSFEDGTAERLLALYESLLGDLVDTLSRRGERPIGDLRLLAESERRQLDRWNATGVEYPEHPVLHHLVAEQARRTPRSVALSQGEESSTWEELGHRSRRLSRLLEGAGAIPGRPVAVLLRPGIERVVTLVAILRAGCPYLPLAPDDGDERILRVLANAQPTLVVTREALVRRLEGAAVPTLALDRVDLDTVDAGAVDAGAVDSDGGEDDDGASDPVETGRRVGPDDLAYILYTSGSTGEPKGVMVSHRAICNRLLWMRDRYPMDASDRILHKTPYTFDVSVWEIFLPLISGAEMVIARPGGQRDPAYLVEVIRHRRVTVVHFVPTLLRHFLEEPGVEDCTSLRRVFASGEALTPALRDRFFERCGAELHNLYGPTEAAVDVTHWHCRRGDRGVVPIGRPIANIELYVLDRRDRQVPVGVVGELVIAGVGLAGGYWRQPELTANRFVELPLGDGPPIRVYRTGDRARFRGDGSLEFLGRLDHQLKIRGIRIEPGEIEMALRAEAGVRDCVVTAEELGDGERRLIAYLVSAETEPSVDALRAGVRRRLGDAFVPAHFYLVDHLPTHRSGKVRRSDLPPPSSCRRLSSSVYRRPSGDREELLAEVWAEVLAVPRVGVDDDFFALGGDSLRCLQARTRTLARGYSFTLEQLFARPTIAGLAPRLEPVSTTTDRPRPAPFALLAEDERRRFEGAYGDAFPLSRLQEALLYHSRNDPDYEIYLLSITVGARLETGILRRALAVLAGRHEMLRVSYGGLDSGRYVQRVHPTVEIPLDEVDLGRLDAEEQDCQLDRWLDHERRRAFDWGIAPLLRFTVHQRSSRAFQLTVAHALFDGWSLSTLLVELLEEYAALSEGRRSPLPPPPRVSYRDFVEAERSAMASRTCREFWRRRLAEMTPSRLGLEPTVPRRARRERRRVVVPAEVVAGLEAVARAVRSPLKSLLLAVHLRVVAWLTGSDRAVTGLITNGRPEEGDGERVLGQFLNTVPIEARFSGVDWRRLTRQIFEQEQAMWPHRRLPFIEIRALVGESPFDTAFNFVDLHVFEAVRRRAGLEITGWKNPSDLTYFPLCAYFAADPLTSRLHFFLDYDARLLDAARVERVLAYYARALATAAADPGAPVGRGVLLSTDELALQEGWGVGPPACAAAPILEQLWRVAAERGQAVAVSCREAELSYDALVRRVETLARRLRRRGVGAGSPVALLADRGHRALIALLAVVEAGGAFVPIDPDLPAARRRLIAEDSGVRWALCDSSTPPALLGPGVVEIAIDGDGADRGGSADRPPCDEPMVAPLPEALAYVLYTSGSTGRPKGVEMTHRGLANIVAAMAATIDFGAHDSWLAVTSLSFDISLLELLVPLARGGRVVIVDRASTRQGHELRHWLETSRATVMQATPSMWRLLLEAGWEGTPGLRIVCGGEAMSRDLAGRLAERGAALWNVYGPTETAIWSACHRLPVESANPGAEPRETAEPAIGGPLAGNTLRVVGPSLDPLPVGVAGELVIGGVGLARGYRGLPCQTAVGFVPDPFGEEPGARLYRTGDRVRWRSDGRLEFLGRIDGQVKLRGVRLELGEVETVLRRHPRVREVVATLHRPADGEPRLRAHVVPEGPKGVEIAELRAHAARHLPGAMIPGEIVAISAFPLTPNRKVDRLALAAMEIERPIPGPVELRGHEILVAELWRELLGREDLGRDDNLFDLGAHSLLVMRASARLSRLAGVEVEPTALFERPTIAAQAVLLGGGGVPHPSPPRTERRGEGRWRALARRRRAAWGGSSEPPTTTTQERATDER